MGIVITGLLMGLSLIVAIGPQNALIIKLGMKKQAIVPVVLTCLISDIFLILGGTMGVGAIIDKAPTALTILSIAGAAYLLWFAFTCFRDARRMDTSTSSTVIEDQVPQSPAQGTSELHGSVAVATRTQTVACEQRTWVKPVLLILGMTWLNPTAYIDTVIMLGGMANQYGEEGRWLFTAGALIASAIWFPTIGWASVKCSKTLAKPRVWRWLNIAVGVIMVFLAFRLLMHL
ncbi:LysE/ArgO family amino acid transporter [Corynebacterium gerontici]|uniref:Arginine exporter protein ArgO n=1 Tax=Corynebacterium gerontici TaxID=2079234 RepID=A0A3G6IZZ7_9CORY|nr:LysE/ArgO family amino acid transporter [Corynebacterium gerontici]AZA11277.1 Arginine exporter protein ArgO [Corynebacterium gerontici]